LIRIGTGSLGKRLGDRHENWPISD
jgi:hypothetical protein